MKEKNMSSTKMRQSWEDKNEKSPQVYLIFIALIFSLPFYSSSSILFYRDRCYPLNIISFQCTWLVTYFGLSSLTSFHILIILSFQSWWVVSYCTHFCRGRLIVSIISLFNIHWRVKRTIHIESTLFFFTHAQGHNEALRQWKLCIFDRRAWSLYI